MKKVKELWRRFRNWFNFKYRYICCDKPMEWQGTNKYACRRCGRTGSTGL